MPTLTILGNGEAFDARLPNTSLLYQGTENVLIDCGLQGAVAVATFNGPRISGRRPDHHHHADHTFGLPALLMSC